MARNYELANAVQSNKSGAGLVSKVNLAFALVIQKSCFRFIHEQKRGTASCIVFVWLFCVHVRVFLRNLSCESACGCGISQKLAVELALWVGRETSGTVWSVTQEPRIAIIINDYSLE